MARIAVRVTPRAVRDEVVRMDADGTVHVRVSSPPVDGAANAAVQRLLGARLGIAARDVVLVAGTSSRVKLFELPLSAEVVRDRIGALV